MKRTIFVPAYNAERGASLTHSWKYSFGTFLVLGHYLRRGGAGR